MARPGKAAEPALGGDRSGDHSYIGRYNIHGHGTQAVILRFVIGNGELLSFHLILG